MTDQPETAIARNVERCEQREGMSSADAEAILAVHEQIELLGPSTISRAQHSDILMRSTKIAREVGGLADALEDRDAAETIVRWINTTYDNPETNRGYRQILRSFGRYHPEAGNGSGELPQSLEWVPAGYPSTYDPAPDPSEMFHWDRHIKPMIDACHNVRDEALIALCWDLGPRTSELHELTVGDITPNEYGLQVSIRNGKNGSRSPTIVRAVRYVRSWLDRHPADSDDYLWTKISSPDRISRNMLRKILREAGDRAAVDLPAKPTPTQLRKSSASYLASRNVNQTFLEDHHGWSRGSDKAARYVAVFGEASDRAIAKAHGVDVDDDPDEPTLTECHRCGQLNEPDRLRCGRCDQALSQEAVEAEEIIDEVLDRFDAEMVAADSIDDRQEYLETKRRLDDLRGSIDIEKVHELASSIESST